MFIFQRLEETMDTHGSVYRQALEAGRVLCASTATHRTESIDHGHLFQELRSLQEAWEQTSALLGRRKALVNTVLQVHTAQDRHLHLYMHPSIQADRTTTSPSL